MIVLDASAVLAIIRAEPGSDQLADMIRGAAVSAVNHSEVVAKLLDQGASHREAVEKIGALRFEIIPFDRPQSEIAGALRETTRALGLSLGDRSCLALAITFNSPVLTADRIWANLDVGVNIKLCR